MRWKYDATDDGLDVQYHGDPVVTDDLLIIPSDARPEGYVYAFELETGEVRWKTPVRPGGVTSHLLHAGSSVLGLTPTGRLVALDVATGALLWSVEDGAESGSYALNAHPLLVGDQVYYGAPDARVRAVAVSSGQVLWSSEIGGRANTAAVVDGEHLLVGAIDRHLYRLALADGSVTARLALPAVPTGTPKLADGLLVLVGGDGLLAAVDSDLEGIVWTFLSPAGWSSFQPLVVDDRVLAGNDDGELYAFELEDGRIIWQEPLAGTLRGIGRSGDRYYVGTLQGTLYAWSPTAAEANDPLSWLTGRWRGSKGDATIEEVWSATEGGNRIGMFRMLSGDAVQFYEFMAIEAEEDEGPVLRIKHYSAGLRGWEEKDESEVFYLRETGARRAVFAQRDVEVPTRLIYTLHEGGELSIVLEKDRPDGTSRSEFRFRRD